MEELSKQFKGFAERECLDSSPLYKYLSSNIANDRELLTLASSARNKQPVPNLLFAAVHFLLLKGYNHPLSKFYPSISDVELDTEDSFPDFRSFCLEYYEELQELISHKLVQTNEVRRCGCLLPAFAFVSRQGKKRPLHCIEIGSSAGLNLLWHKYGYNYGRDIQWGNPDSPVQINCTLRGNKPLRSQLIPEINSCIGIDINPIDLSNSDEVLWLRALIWPEHQERFDLLDSAIQVAQKYPPTIIAGDAVEKLPEILSSVPQDVTLLIFHSFVLNQFSSKLSEKLFSLLAQHSLKQDIFVVSIEVKGTANPLVKISLWERGIHNSQTLAHCSPHGDWIEWLVDGY